MKFLNLASSKSFWRGFDYYESNKVLSWEKIDDQCIKGKIEGSDDQVYDVYIDIGHPRKSYCKCPFADGRRVICKHMVALYLTVFPEKAEEIREYQEEEESYYEDEEKERESYLKIIREDITNYVNKLPEEEVRQLLINRMVADLYEDEWEEY